MKKKWLVVLIILLFLVAFILRLVPIRMSHGWDETVYLQHAEIIFSDRDNFDERAIRPPLISIFIALGYFIYHSVVTASIITALLGALGVVFIFLVGKKLYNTNVGLIAAIILALTPFIIKNSNLIMADVPVATLLTISFYLLLFHEKKWLMFFAGIFLGLSVLTKFPAVLIILVFIAYFYINRVKWNKILLSILGFSIVMIPYFIWCYVKFGNFLEPFITAPKFAAVTNQPFYFYLINLYTVFTIIIILGLVLWIMSIIIKIRKKDYSEINIDFILMFWIFILLIYLSNNPHKLLRYLMPIAPPLILLASKGFDSTLSKIGKWARPILILAIIVYLGFLVSSLQVIDYLQKGEIVDYTKSDEVKISEYIINEMNYTGIVYASHEWPIIAYYTGLNMTHISYNEKVYEQISVVMPKIGIIVGNYYHEVPPKKEVIYFNEKRPKVEHPTSKWMKNDTRFTFVKSIGSQYIFYYNPNATNN